MERTNKLIVATVFLALFTLEGLAADQKPGSTAASAPRWSVQVEELNAGGVNLDPAFQVAIYENLITELEKAKIFDNVYRSGDRKANGKEALLILKINVREFEAGSETKRAVTTVAGATKIKVEYRLQTRAGQTVTQQVVAATVRFYGNNMRVTTSLAHKVAGVVKKSQLPEPPTTVSAIPQPFAGNNCTEA